MTSFVRNGNDPSNPARFQHLAERMFGICEQCGWKHDPVPERERLFAFWPWGLARPPVHTTAAILQMGAGKLEEQVGLVMLGVQWRVPAPLVDGRLLELLDMCARYDVCLTVGERHPDPDRPWPSVEVVLT